MSKIKTLKEALERLNDDSCYVYDNAEEHCKASEEDYEMIRDFLDDIEKLVLGGE